MPYQNISIWGGPDENPGESVYKAGVRRDKYQYHGWSTRKGGLPINLSTHHHQHQNENMALETLRKRNAQI